MQPEMAPNLPHSHLLFFLIRNLSLDPEKYFHKGWWGAHERPCGTSAGRGQGAQGWGSGTSLAHLPGFHWQFTFF